MTSPKVPTTVYAEMTPNPATMKYVANRYLVEREGEVAEYRSQQEAKGSSPLAESLFNFPFIKAVFITSNFVTVTKNDSVSWDLINMELREFVRDFLENNEKAVIKMPELSFGKAVNENGNKPEVKVEQEIRTGLDRKIVSLLDEYVKPAVESDGGAIDFKSFKDGKVTVVLRGSCSGCPSSTATLKHGIENLLKQHIPQIQEVVAEEL
jgi:NFU1 iron-sulfur cluster scaffold homolog, mitochondrial